MFRPNFMLAVVMCMSTFAIRIVDAAETIPNEVQLPGTQPDDIGGLESVTRCDNCHGGYNQSYEPHFNWQGSMMANATRDPIFWATVAIAEQDFDGAGDLCLRCHTPPGWLDGHSTPTDGSALVAGDTEGVNCDTCHQMVDPTGLEHSGAQFAPFVANDQLTPPTGYFGSGMFVIYNGGSEKLGPYSATVAPHQFAQSDFHRSAEFCGTCHDVSNSVVGDLAHNAGAQDTADPVIQSLTPGSPVATKAAFNNFPFQYGIVERTFSEYMASAFPTMLVSSYGALPADLRRGAIEFAYQSALVAGTGGNYADNTPRYFTCQTCHLPPVTGEGCNRSNAPTRPDLPYHDMTGGNNWIPQAINYMNTQGTLVVGGGLDASETAAIEAGRNRAEATLALAAAVDVTSNTLRLTNLTAHKLISGYPEGRRMWLNIEWYDQEDGQLLREDGAYGPMQVIIDGNTTSVNSILDMDDPYLKVYEAHYGMTQEWASQLLGLGYPANLVLSYDRVTGAPDYTLDDLAAQAPKTAHETFHFVLNNIVIKDNRIPPYGMDYEEARKRNALPVPADQYGDPGTNGVYNYWDELELKPPPGSHYAEAKLLYQPTSWEYIQFLHLANDQSISFLANEGVNLLNAWLNTGMAKPFEMTAATFIPCSFADANCDGQITVADYAAFAPCVLGPEEGVTDECKRHDANLDGDVDLDDYRQIQLLLSTP